MTAARPPLLAATEALYLDFDGTLADFAPRPDRVVVPQPLPELLIALHHRLGGAVAVVSGRALADVDRLLAPARLAGAGVHGAELRLSPADRRAHPRPPALDGLARELRARFGADPRLVIEDKGAGVALHYRQAPEREADCVSAVSALASVSGLQLLQGNRVVEARPHGVDKGSALRMLSLHAPFAARRPVFVGDDTTDEDGFRAAAAQGGYGVKVGPGGTAAPYRFDDVSDVRAWLAASLRAMQGEEAR